MNLRHFVVGVDRDATPGSAYVVVHEPKLFVASRGVTVLCGHDGSSTLATPRGVQLLYHCRECYR